MGEERTSNEIENLSLQANSRFPRDLLQRFMVGAGGGSRRSDPEDEDSGGGDVELNLGLSLGGRFGVDKSSGKLMRSSSIASVLPVVRDDDVLGGGQKTGAGGSYSGLVRTSSLPVETEEEWRKRKELQSLRRLAAKRRRSEKQRNLTKGERDEYVAALGRVGSSPGPLFGSGNWVSGSAPKPAGLVGGSAGAEGFIGKGKGNSAGAGGGAPFTQPSSQGSVESHGGSCSSMSEFESRHLQGSSSGGEASPVSMQSVQERSNQEATGSSRSKALERPEKENPSRNRGKEIGMNSVEDMPCVFTQGDGPNGRRIEGILYKYGKGEEVKIMCVCHGSFLSPAEFVKHAGGTDVVHPLKHIVVNPNPSSLL